MSGVTFKKMKTTAQVLVAVYTRYSQSLARIGLKVAADYYATEAAKVAASNIEAMASPPTSPRASLDSLI